MERAQMSLALHFAQLDVGALKRNGKKKCAKTTFFKSRCLNSRKQEQKHGDECVRTGPQTSFVRHFLRQRKKKRG
jgi:hypothetical protein